MAVIVRGELKSRTALEAVVHHLKIFPENFLPVKKGIKTAEIRRHDRDFAVGDVLLLSEWDGEKFTGDYVVRTITHILGGGRFGIEAGYYLLSMSKN